MGGETISNARADFKTSGLSPRGRGNLAAGATLAVELRSIPAWAGKPVRAHSAHVWMKVYPRVGGETPVLLLFPNLPPGLSPRGRGNLWLHVSYTGMFRSIPTWAGNRSARKSARRTRGSIPAWAGKPLCLSESICPRRVYPRVGGETSSASLVGKRHAGLSPRGRGNLIPTRTAPEGLRSIPAWAGKPYGCHRMHHQLRVYPRVGGET